MSNPLKARYDLVYFFDITDGNPNGDPDAGNLPRLDPETGQGLVTDVCLKRKIRNFVELVGHHEEPAGQHTPGLQVFVREGAILNRQIEEAYEQSEFVKKSLAEWARYELARKPKRKPAKDKNEGDPNAGSQEAEKVNKTKLAKQDKIQQPSMHYEDVARQWMCDQFFDIRAFGAVMTTGKEKDTPTGESEGEDSSPDQSRTSKIRRTAGQVRGPVQFGMARSVHPIIAQEHALTVCAARTEDKPIEDQVGIQGRKFTVPYALYRVHGYVSANLASGPNGTGFSEADLDLLKRALDQMFEHDKSAARANMRPVACVAFKHESPLGNARADKLFARVVCKPKPGVQPLPGEANGDTGDARPPRSFADYELIVDEANLPAGVTVERWIDWA